MKTEIGYKIKVRAGPGSEEGKDIPFRYVTSPIPSEVESVDEELYATCVQSALKAAAKAVEATGRCLDLTLEVRPSQ